MTDSDSPLTSEETRKLSEISRLLDEAYQHWFDHAPDHHSKSLEGAISIQIPSWWKRRVGIPDVRVNVFSYVLGPSRWHEFDGIDEALATVKEWHRKEMEHDYSQDW